jgi:hypothetical protein
MITNSILLGRVGQTINLTTSGGNGNSITFSVKSGTVNSCVITGSTLKAVLATSCEVTAIQDSVSGSTKVVSSPITFAFTLTPSKVSQSPLILDVENTNAVAFTPVQLAVRGGSGTGSARYSVSGTGCSIQGNTVVANRVTTCSVIASKDGDEQYNQAFAAFVLLRFDYATQPVFTINNSVTSFVDTATVGVVTQGGAGTGAIKLRILNPNDKCIISQLSISANGATTCQIVAVKSADTGYSEATSQSVVFTFRKP